MLVLESPIFNPSEMRVRISSMEGVDWIVSVKHGTTVDELKRMAANHFYSSVEGEKAAVQHRVVHVGSLRTLTDDKSVAQEGVKDGDELLLLHKRLPGPIQDTPPKRDDPKGPSYSAIQSATAHIPVKNRDRVAQEPANMVDFQVELRKILVSLIEASQRILCLNPQAAKIIREAQELMEEQAAPKPMVNPEALKQLTDMGFSEVRATKALILKKTPANAMEWLLEHDADPDIDSPLPVMEAMKHEQQVTQTQKSNEASAADPESDIVHPTKVANVLECFRAFKRKGFRPNPTALQNLMEMGFSEKDVIDALRVSGNNQDAACEWLLSDRKPNVKDLDEGLDPNSSVYKAIMANPVVQLGLNNPRSLLAFLHMLENPTSTNQWLHDPDTGPMLIQISRIYHAEKYHVTSNDDENAS